jgi:muramoyltetrapeptide carboxypeptidase
VDAMSGNRHPALPRVRPPTLRRGDAVGIVAPASNIKKDALLAGCDGLRCLGYEPVYGESILEQDLYFAGSAQRRIQELQTMFQREDVRAILCARGGYGCNYLVDGLDLNIVRRHPKIFMGYSDVTSLLTLLSDEAGLVVFHGPMVTKDFIESDGIDVASWESALSGSMPWDLPDSGMKGLTTGSVEGTFYGGCLPMLAATLGTHHEIQAAGTILFLEDIASKPFQIDRMLMQLKLAGKFEGVRGIVFGEMNDCVQHPEQPYTLEEVVLRVVGDLGIPVAFGLRSGHVARRNITLPIGVRASLVVTGESAQLQFLEPATTV